MHFGPVTVNPGFLSLEGRNVKFRALAQQPEVDLLVAAEYDIQVEKSSKQTMHCQREQTGDSEDSDSYPFYPRLQHVMFIAGLCSKTCCSCVT